MIHEWSKHTFRHLCVTNKVHFQRNNLNCPKGIPIYSSISLQVTDVCYLFYWQLDKHPNMAFVVIFLPYGKEITILFFCKKVCILHSGLTQFRKLHWWKLILQHWYFLFFVLFSNDLHWQKGITIYSNVTLHVMLLIFLAS